MKPRFLTFARMELEETVAWYEEQSPGLGREFLDEVDRAVRRSLVFPQSCAEIEPSFRRCLLARFPYGLIFRIDEEFLVVVAVAHLHREPRYWFDHR